ncbi:MAG: hypothetical protein M5U19_23000 [Microthrixaceae bacterium]|nr:hypothetical protein [Microthrixaceae bacterium]
MQRDVEFLGLRTEGDDGRYSFGVEDRLARLDGRLYGRHCHRGVDGGCRAAHRSCDGVDDHAVRCDRARQRADLGAGGGAGLWPAGESGAGHGHRQPR